MQIPNSITPNAPLPQADRPAIDLSLPRGENSFILNVSQWERRGNGKEQRAEAAQRILSAWFRDNKEVDLNLKGLNLKTLPDVLEQIRNVQKLNLLGNPLEAQHDFSVFRQLRILLLDEDVHLQYPKDSPLLPRCGIENVETPPTMTISAIQAPLASSSPVTPEEISTPQGSHPQLNAEFGTGKHGQATSRQTQNVDISVHAQNVAGGDSRRASTLAQTNQFAPVPNELPVYPTTARESPRGSAAIREMLRKGRQVLFKKKTALANPEYGQASAILAEHGNISDRIGNTIRRGAKSIWRGLGNRKITMTRAYQPDVNVGPSHPLTRPPSQSTFLIDSVQQQLSSSPIGSAPSLTLVRTPPPSINERKSGGSTSSRSSTQSNTPIGSASSAPADVRTAPPSMNEKTDGRINSNHKSSQSNTPIGSTSSLTDVRSTAPSIDEKGSDESNPNRASSQSSIQIGLASSLIDVQTTQPSINESNSDGRNSNRASTELSRTVHPQSRHEVQEIVAARGRDLATGRDQNQIEMISFVESHLNDSPLEFFEAIARKNSAVAAYFAVQVQRMITPIESITQYIGFVQADHPAVKIGDAYDAHFASHHILRAKSDEFRGAPINSPEKLLHYILLDDLKTEIDRQNKTLSDADRENPRSAHAVTPPIFALGLTTAISSEISPTTAANSSALRYSMSGEELLNKIEDIKNSTVSLLEFTKELAQFNPSAAAFFCIAEHALRAKQGNLNESLVRYDYGSRRDADTGVTTEDCHATFLDGVAAYIIPDGDEARWCIRRGDQWSDPRSKQEVLEHVFAQALGHLQLEGPTDRQEIYPLVTYELLADAFGLPVPQYLRDHELGILNKVEENQVAKQMRDTKNKQAGHATRETKDAGVIAAQREYAAYGVTNMFQAMLCRAGYDTNIAMQSVDRTFPLSVVDGNIGPAIDSLKISLSKTHQHEQIASQSHAMDRDNQCWLRSSWLSVFASMTPDMLASRLKEICSSHMVDANAEILKTIAQQFKADPIAFMEGVDPGQRAPSKGNGARLGASKKVFMDEGRNPKSMETRLRSLQLKIAAAFREEMTSLMSELQGHQRSTSQATSDLPVTLHRAFGLPVMVVETGGIAAGGQAHLDLKIRVAAPKGDAHAVLTNTMDKVVNHGGQFDRHNKNSLKDLLAHFENYPVLWLEKGHFDVYFPHSFYNNHAANPSASNRPVNGVNDASQAQRIRRSFIENLVNVN